MILYMNTMFVATASWTRKLSSLVCHKFTTLYIFSSNASSQNFQWKPWSVWLWPLHNFP